MTGHRLGRTNRDLCGALAEYALDRLGLGEIALLGRGAMRVDIIDFVWIEVAVFQAHPHTFGGAASLRRWRRDVIGVAIGSIAANFGEDLCAALNRSVALLEDECGRALGHNETVAQLVERAARFLRLIVAGR